MQKEHKFEDLLLKDEQIKSIISKSFGNMFDIAKTVAKEQLEKVLREQEHEEQ